MLRNLFLRVKILTKTKATKRLTLVVLALAIGSIIVLAPIGAKADTATALTNVVAFILNIFVDIIGSIISLILPVLINIAQFNDFTTASAVTTGWVLIRDVCNMFFIVILLVISVGTILNIESYG